MLDDDFCLIGAVDFTFECPLASGLRGEVVVSEKKYPNFGGGHLITPVSGTQNPTTWKKFWSAE